MSTVSAPSNELRMITEGSQRRGKRLVNQPPPLFEAVAAGCCTQNVSFAKCQNPSQVEPSLGGCPAIFPSFPCEFSIRSSGLQQFLPCGGTLTSTDPHTTSFYHSPRIVRSRLLAQTSLSQPGLYKRLHKPLKSKTGQDDRRTAWASVAVTATAGSSTDSQTVPAADVELLPTAVGRVP